MLLRRFQPVLSKDQKYVEDIVKEILSKPNHKKIVHKEEAFLMWAEGEVSVCVRPGRILISNHEYLFDEPFSLYFTDSIKKIVSKSIGEEIKKIKKEVFSNKMDLLRKIFITIKKE